MQAVSALAQTERIAASVCGHSGIACMHFAHLMCCIERPARFLSPAEATHGGTGFLKAGDVILLASRGGKTRELIPIMEIARKKGAKIIAVTENQASPLAMGSDIVLPLAVTRETDRFNSHGTEENDVVWRSSAMNTFRLVWAMKADGSRLDTMSF